jgi:hypothetical protein
VKKVGVNLPELTHRIQNRAAVQKRNHKVIVGGVAPTHSLPQILEQPRDAADCVTRLQRNALHLGFPRWTDFHHVD